MQRIWIKKLGHAEFAHNKTPSSTTKHLPFEIVYEVNPYVPIDMIALPKDKYVHGDAKQQDDLMTSIHKEICQQIEKANEVSKK